MTDEIKKETEIKIEKTTEAEIKTEEKEKTTELTDEELSGVAGGLLPHF